MSKQSGTQTTTNKIDPALQAMYQYNFDQAKNIANQPYTPYTGNMVAPLADQTMQGINMGTGYASSNLGLSPLQQGAQMAAQAGGYSPQMVNSSGLNASTGQWNNATAQQYMNPYQQQVIDTTANELNRQGQIQQNANDAAATTAGAYGGTRQAVADTETQRNTQQNIANTTANLLNSGYTNAQNMFSSDQARALQAAQGNQQYGMQAQLANQQAGLTGANLGLGAASLLNQSGLAQQQWGQNNANAMLNYGSVLQNQQQNQNQWDYQNNYLNPQNWDLRGLNALTSTTGGMNFGNAGTSSTPLYTNPLSTIAGGASLGASIGGPWGALIGGGAGLLGSLF